MLLLEILVRKKVFIGTIFTPCMYSIKICDASKRNKNANKMHFIINIQREKESRITSRSRLEDISLGRHALTFKPRLTPRSGLCQSMSPRLISSDLELDVILDSHNPISI